jgi:hypothetical protein
VKSVCSVIFVSVERPLGLTFPVYTSLFSTWGRGGGEEVSAPPPPPRTHMSCVVTFLGNTASWGGYIFLKYVVKELFVLSYDPAHYMDKNLCVC